MKLQTLQILKDNQRGASLVEYALLVAMLAVVSIVVVTVLGEKTRVPLEKAEQHLTGEGVVCQEEDPMDCP